MSGKKSGGRRDGNIVHNGYIRAIACLGSLLVLLTIVFGVSNECTKLAERS